MNALCENLHAESEAHDTPRHIRSYVLRQGRVSNAQHRYHKEMMARIGVPYVPAKVDLNAVFGRTSPCIFEIGFGMGETSAAIAEAGLSNQRIVQHDAVDVLRDMIQPGALSGVHIFFPDPWPKARHHKRRLIQPPLVALIASRLAPGAYIHCATDWEDYANQMLEVLSAEPVLENTSRDFAPRPDHRPLTKFEQRGLRLGHDVWDVVFRRRQQLL